MIVKMVSENEVSITTACPFCGKVTVLVVPADDFMAWQNGSLVQNVFPYLSAEDREVLISGMCIDCQDSIFG